MSVKIRGVDTVQIVENEFRIEVLDILLKWIIEQNPNMNKPSLEDIKNIQSIVYDKLKKKYPNLSIELKDQ